MNKLEKKLAECTWIRIGNTFTTVYNDFGFVIYRENRQIWLAGLSKEVTRELLKKYRTKPPKIKGFWVRSVGGGLVGEYTSRMFVIPASNEFVVRVLESSLSELKL